MTNETNHTTLFDTSLSNGKPGDWLYDEKQPVARKLSRLGKVPSGWQATSLQRHIAIHHGFTFKSEHFVPHGLYQLTTPGNFFEEGGFRHLGKKQKYYEGPIPSGYILEPGDLIVAMTEQADGLLGSTAIVPSDGGYLHNQRIGRIEAKSDQIVPAFIYYVFNSNYFRREVKRTAAGTKVKHTSPTKLREILVLLPPTSEQRKIACILGAWDRALADLDALIKAKRRKKKGLAQRLLTGRVRLPGFGGTEMIESKIGAVPSDWREVRFGKVFKRQSEKNEGSPIDHVITVGKYAIRPQSEHFDKSVASADLSNYNVIRPGDFVYDPMSAYYGAIGRYDYDEPGIVSPVYRVLKLRRGFDSGFIKHLLSAHYVRYRIASYSTQGNKKGKRRGLQHSAFKAIPVFVPSKKEQRKIAAVLDAADAEIAALEAQRDALARQKRGLMQRLLTGEVRVTPDPEDHRPKEPGA